MKISRRKFIAGVTVLGAAALAGSYRSLQQSPQSRPNIILFIADDMRYDAAGFAGNSIIHTPNLDQLAKSSLVFTNHFVTTAICPTSRASIMSGEYALKHRVYDFNQALPSAVLARSFPVLLRKAGYHTGFIGKWGLGGVQPAKSFDWWRGYAGQGEYYSKKNAKHLTDIQTKQALEFLRNRPEGKPFLLIVSYKAPHGPLVAQSRLMTLYDDAKIPRKMSDHGKGGAQLPSLLRHSRNYKKYPVLVGKEKRYQLYMKRYYSLISGIDDSIRQILSQLDSMNQIDNTGILFTSDNGLLQGEHRLTGKTCMYEEAIRVPLLIRPPPRFFPDHFPLHVETISINIDLAPTILSMAAITPPPQVESRNLLGMLQNSDDAPRKGFYYENPSMPQYETIGCEGYRSEQWKYVRYFNRTQSEEQLFDLASDPYELENLAAKARYKDRMEELRRTTIQEKRRLKTA